MRMERCARGHFYDADKYPSCPYCAGNAGSGAPMEDNATLPYDAPMPQGQPQGFRSPQPAPAPYRQPGPGMQQPGQAGPGIAPQPYQPGPRVMPAGARPSNPSELEVTRPMNGMGGPGSLPETRPMNSNVKRTPSSDVTVNRGAADDEKTMAFFDDIEDVKKEKPKPVFAQRPVVGWLVCTYGSNYGRSFPLFAGNNFIGRSQKMDIYLQGDQAVSRDIHAIVTYEPRMRQFYAHAGNSHSLLYVNGKVVLSGVELHDRDQVLIGDTTLVFVPFCDERFSWKRPGRTEEEESSGEKSEE